MNERERGSDPIKHLGEEQHETLLPEYHQAARYIDEASSETAYVEAQRTIFEMPCSLATYRLVLMPDSLWHVAVLGNMPADEVHQRLTNVLATGESVVLPNDVLIALNQHRREQPTIDGWAEQHSHPHRLRLR